MSPVWLDRIDAGAGVEIFTVSRRLGHSDTAFTMNRYGHLVPGMQRTAAHALDHLFAENRARRYPLPAR